MRLLIKKTRGFIVSMSRLAKNSRPSWPSGTLLKNTVPWNTPRLYRPHPKIRRLCNTSRLIPGPRSAKKPCTRENTRSWSMTICQTRNSLPSDLASSTETLTRSLPRDVFIFTPSERAAKLHDDLGSWIHDRPRSSKPNLAIFQLTFPPTLFRLRMANLSGG